MVKEVRFGTFANIRNGFPGPLLAAAMIISITPE